MDRLDTPETVPEPMLPEPAAPTPLEQRFATCCADFAHTLRCLEGVSAQAARVLETGGEAMHLLGLLQTLDRLVTDAGVHSATLGSISQCTDCVGSA